MTTGLEDSFPGMEKIPGGTYMMGSNRHYPEEAPAHCGEANWAQIDLEKDDQESLNLSRGTLQGSDGATIKEVKG